MSSLQEQLNFDSIPSKLKDYIYDKYDADSISLKYFGTIDKDYLLVVIVYDDRDMTIPDDFGSYQIFNKSIENNIYSNYKDLVKGSMLLDDKIELFIELFNQEDFIKLLEY